MERARVHLAGNLDQTGRLVLLGLGLVVGVLPFISAAVVLRTGWRPVGDNALIGLRVHDVLRARFPLIGQPSTGGNFGSGIASNHPGPIEFYLVAPFVAILGPTWGLAIGAAAINAGSMVTALWVGFRRGGLALCAMVALGLVAMSHSIGGNVLHDPVSSQVGAMASVLVILTAWSVVAGDLRMIPLFLFCASFALQDHLGYLVTVGPVTGLGVVGGAWWLRRSRLTATRRSRERSGRSAWYIGLGFFVVWLPVLWDEAFGAANLQAVWRTFSSGRTVTEGLSFALKRLLDAVGPVPIFARTVAPLGFLRPPSLAASIGATLVMGAIAGMTAMAWRRRRIDLVAQAAIALAAIVGGVFSAVKLPIGAGVQTSNLRWMWFVSLFVWITVAWQAWELARPVDRRQLRPVLVGVAAALLPLAWVGTTSSVRLSTDRDGLVVRPVAAFSRAIRDELPRGSYRVAFRGGPVLLTVGPALVHDLDYSLYRPFVDLGVFTRAYTTFRSYKRQDVRGTLLITSLPDRPPDRGRLLASMRFQEDLGDSAGGTGEVRAYLLATDAKIDS